MGILIMNNYLAIIRKSDFVDLFKYGQFGISYAVQFDGNLFEHANDDGLFGALTERMNMYEYSFEYLIIHFKAIDYNGQYVIINVQNVCGLYTFDEEAKKEMSISFDSRIQLHVSPWSDKFEKLQQGFSIKQCTRGIDNLWTIFDLPKEDRAKCEEIVNEETVQEVFRELYAYERPSGDLSIWTYLLRYERHSFYPKGMLGVFCDLIHVVCNYSKKKELNGEVAEDTQLYSQLKACNNTHFASLLKIVEKSRLFSLTEEASGCKFAIAAPLFLHLRSQFLDGMEHKQKEELISYSKKIGGFECSVAVYLLGIALGYDKTYDAFYETEELPFFKKRSVEVIPSKMNGGFEVGVSRFPKDNSDEDIAIYSKPEDEIKVSENDLVSDTLYKGCGKQIYQQGDLFSHTHNDKLSKKIPLLWVKKKSNGKDSKADVRPVYDDKELEHCKCLGYEPVKRFTPRVKEVITSYGFIPEKEKKRLKEEKKRSKEENI